MTNALKAASGVLFSLAVIGTTLASIDDTGVYKYDYPVVPEVLNEDTYYDNGVLLRNITMPDNLGDTEGTITASFEGSGMLVVGDQKNGGYPRVVIPAGDVSVDYVYPENVTERVYWDGRITPPKRTLRPNKAEVVFETAGNHFGDIELEAAYQIGLDQETFRFPSGTAFVFFLDVPDKTRVWYGRQLNSDEVIEAARSDDNNDDELWMAGEEDFCVIKNKLCVITDETVLGNKIVFFQESFSACPNLRIDNGYYSGAPHCNTICNPGYELDFATYTCVKEGSNAGLTYEVDLSNRADYNIDYKLRPGYFSYRDSRGSQLEQRDTTGLDGSDLAEVQYANVVKSPRKNRDTNSQSDDKLDKIWNELQNLDFKFWQSQNEVRPDPELIMDNPAQTYEEKVENCENCAPKTESFGAVLPRTGPAGFIGVALLGLFLVSLGLRRR